MTDTRAQQCRGGSSAGAMLLVLIISRGLERSADAALVVAEHEGALDEVRHGRELVLAEHVLDEGEDALSDAAEEGAIAKMMRAAFAHVGKRGLYAR